jgi:hypothetical protein
MMAWLIMLMADDFSAEAFPQGASDFPAGIPALLWAESSLPWLRQRRRFKKLGAPKSRPNFFDFG